MTLGSEPDPVPDEPADEPVPVVLPGPVSLTPALVLLSGMLGDSALWAGVAECFPRPAVLHPSRIDLDDSVEEMAASVLADAPPRFALAGHSLGGIVALAILRKEPGRVSHLALLNSTARPPTSAQLDAWQDLRDRLQGGEFEQVADELAAANLAGSRRDDAELVRRSRAMAESVGSAGLLRQLAAQATRPDSTGLLGSIRCPTLVVTGALDDVCPAAAQEELVEAIPGAEHLVLEGVGHTSPLEAPERVAQALADLLSRGSGGGPA